MEGGIAAEIGPGALVFLGVERGDEPGEADDLAGRTARLRIWEDESGRMNRALAPACGSFLVVSQFTLCADTSRGNRPSFLGAAPPEVARPLVERYVRALRSQGVCVETGVFGAEMDVELVNAGPVTILLEKRA